MVNFRLYRFPLSRNATRWYPLKKRPRGLSESV
jgi:hypothetical protein